MKKLISSLLLILLSVFSFPLNAQFSPTTGAPLNPEAPIDSSALILLGIAVLLIIAFVMYKRINAKRLA